MSKMSCDCNVIHEDILNDVQVELEKKTRLDEVSVLFKVMGDQTRISILQALLIHEMCVCDLSVLLDMTQSAISHQLRVLKDNRLIKRRKEGKVVFYSIHDKHVELLLNVAVEHILEV